MQRGRPKKEHQFCSMKLEKTIYEILKTISSNEKTTMTKIVEKSVKKYSEEHFMDQKNIFHTITKEYVEQQNALGVNDALTQFIEWRLWFETEPWHTDINSVIAKKMSEYYSASENTNLLFSWLNLDPFQLTPNNLFNGLITHYVIQKAHIPSLYLGLQNHFDFSKIKPIVPDITQCPIDVRLIELAEFKREDDLLFTEDVEAVINTERERIGTLSFNELLERINIPYGGKEEPLEVELAKEKNNDETIFQHVRISHSKFTSSSYDMVIAQRLYRGHEADINAFINKLGLNISLDQFINQFCLHL